MKKLMLWMAVCCIWTGCQKGEMNQVSEDESAMRLEASIGKGAVESRTATAGDGQTTFVAEDKIGFFHTQSDQAYRWSFTGTEWVPEVSLNWDNKVNKFHFCAFYPYQEGAVRSAVPMPDLTLQTGEASQIGAYDFLAAHCQTAYTDASGVVSFTGETAFRHVCALIKIVVQKETVDGAMTVHQLKVEGEGIASPHTYAFGESFETDQLVAAGSAVSTLSFDEEAELSENSHTWMMVINPVELDAPLKLSIDYTREGIYYQAETVNLPQAFVAGNMYQYTVRLKKETIIIEGNTVTNWESQTNSEIWVDETPADAQEG